MPVPEVMKLDQSSSPEQVKAAISACIATEVGNGHPQDQAVAMCNSMVNAKTKAITPAPNPITPNTPAPNSSPAIPMMAPPTL